MSELFETDLNPEPTQLDRIESKLDELLALKKRVVKPRTAKEEAYSSEFNSAWAEYPRRVGANSKSKAYASWCARLKEAAYSPEVADGMYFATVEYCRFCDATIEDKRYVMQGATFYGCNKLYQSDWTIPDTVKKSAIPRDNDEMLTWAVKKGMRQPHQGESWNQYRAYIEGEA